ncbi:allophanate hydrolase [Gracilibacillus phocaeensis]|uniref:allophanate hydrolase n=1 Tax=Gracilibacillus phocaeensis TaxID=2042304 RepID=UPI001030EAA0|nr:allophanate hydrolase [Gracilibacillus phocaeensis]
MKSWTITALQKGYQTGESHPRQVMEAIIKQAEAEKDKNIWITAPDISFIEPYLSNLENIDQDTAPLWGIPFSVKDNIDVAGLPTTAGCQGYAYTPETHATVVQRLVDAGAVPVGKTNLDQFATGLVGTRSPYGATHNGLKSELISGGSSSGSAVSVARGQAVFSLGTDTAGSGRVPAALNGVIGFKPSLGAWPVKGVVPACVSLDCVAVFAHQLSDVQLIHEIIQGEDKQDPWSKSYAKKASGLPKKIVLPKQPFTFYGPYQEEYQTAWEKNVRQWEALPFAKEYVELDLFLEAAAILYDGPWIAERWAAVGDFVTNHTEEVLPETKQVLTNGKPENYSAAALFQAMHRLKELQLEVRKILKDAVLVLPTCGGTWTREQVAKDPIETNSKMGLYTNHCNLLDLCAIAVPAGEAADTVPFGLTIFGLAGQDAVIQGAADLFQQQQSEFVEVAVCGLHMRGFPFEKQMKEHLAIFSEEATTAPVYRMVRLSGNVEKPGLIRVRENGESIELEVWKMPVDQLGAFANSIPAPLGLGKVELADGREVLGFLCEAYVQELSDVEDITQYKSWRSIS